MGFFDENAPTPDTDRSYTGGSRFFDETAGAPSVGLGDDIQMVQGPNGQWVPANSAGAGGSNAVSRGSGLNKYGGKKSLDPAVMRKEIIDGFSRLGYGKPTEAQINEIIKYGSVPDTYSDGKDRVGVNDYLIHRIATGKSSWDPSAAGDDGVIEGGQVQPGGGMGGGGGFGAWDAPFEGKFEFGDFNPGDPFVAPERKALPTLADGTPAPTYTRRADFRPTNAQDLYDDPSYQWVQDEALRRLQATKAAQGTLMGGGTMRAAAQLASGLASQEFGNVDARRFRNYQQDVAGDQQNFGNQMTSWQGNEGSRLNTFDRNFNAINTGNEAAFADAYNTHNVNVSDAYQAWQANMAKALEEFRSAYDVFTGNQDRAFDKNYRTAALYMPTVTAQTNADQGYDERQGNLTVGRGQSTSAGIQGQGNANSAGVIGRGNARANAWGNIGNNAMDAAAFYAVNGGGMRRGGTGRAGMFQ